MKIYVVGSSKNNFLPLDNIREKFLVDEQHEGDNIDNLNPWYCELTCLYYLWKHCDEDIVGLEHYRRYFGNDKLLSESEIKKYLENNDIIMYYNKQNSSAIADMTNTNKKLEIYEALAVIKYCFNEDMYNFFNDYCNTPGAYLGNMFICKKEIINEYCDWLFKLLEIFDKCDKFKKPRIDGYIAEYFFGPYMLYTNKKIANVNRIVFDKTLKNKLKHFN